MTGSHLLMLQAPLLKLDGGVHPETRFIRLSGFTESAAFDATRWDSVCGLSARQRHNSARNAPMAYPRPACATRGNAAYGCSSSSTIDACIILCPTLSAEGAPPDLPEALKRSNSAANALLPVLPIVTHGARRLPPSGSTAGSALSPTPPQGGSDTGAPYASLISLPP